MSGPEAGLQRAVIDIARLHDVRVHHARAARMPSGRWATPLQGDRGFVDLVLAGRSGVLFRELKSLKGRLQPDQRVWLARMGDAGLNVSVWTPVDLQSGLILDEIKDISRR